MLNVVAMVGNVVKDPEVRYTANGKAVLNMRIASTTKVKSGEEWKDETCFIGVVIWGKRAENCAQQLKKGSPVFIEGRLQSRSWEKDGFTQYATEILVNNIQFLDRTKEGTSQEEDDFLKEE